MPVDVQLANDDPTVVTVTPMLATISPTQTSATVIFSAPPINGPFLPKFAKVHARYEVPRSLQMLKSCPLGWSAWSVAEYGGRRAKHESDCVHRLGLACGRRGYRDLLWRAWIRYRSHDCHYHTRQHLERFHHYHAGDPDSFFNCSRIDSRDLSKLHERSGDLGDSHLDSAAHSDRGIIKSLTSTPRRRRQGSRAVTR